MRASRLMTLLFTLQRRRGATAAELARELEVSERTIYRDIIALAEAGSRSGPNPYVAAESGSLTDGAPVSTGLPPTKQPRCSQSVHHRSSPSWGWARRWPRPRAKLLATLPEGLREHARSVAERFLLDAPGWFHTPQQVTQLAVVAAAVWEQRRLQVLYRRGAGDHADEVQRLLDPLGLVLKAGVWYLVSRAVPDALRSYRLDRVLQAEPTGDVFDRPVDFDLAAWWADSAQAFEGSLLRAVVRLRLSPRGLRWLPHVTDQHAAIRAVAAAESPEQDGWREVVLEVEDLQVAQGQLTGLGAEVEVLNPPSLRAALAGIGAEMATRNGLTPPP